MKKLAFGISVSHDWGKVEFCFIGVSIHLHQNAEEECMLRKAVIFHFLGINLAIGLMNV